MNDDNNDDNDYYVNIYTYKIFSFSISSCSLYSYSCHFLFCVLGHKDSLFFVSYYIFYSI